MSYQHWELLTRMATGSVDDLTSICQELVRRSEVERLFCVVRRAQQLEVVAVDCDGYPLGFAEQRLRDSEFGELSLTQDGAGASTVVITRKVNRASRRTVLVARLALAADWAVTLVLENRFSGAELATLDDQSVEQWVILVGLAVRLAALSAANSTTPSQPSLAPTPDARRRASGSEDPGAVVSQVRLSAVTEREYSADEDAEELDSDPAPAVPDSLEAQAERRETLGALDSQDWNISRAARVLGMTRHGLKKRMRRLHVARPA